jgi:lipopolysaccharide transport system ATP-binding protein
VNAPAIDISGLDKEFRLYPDLVKSRLKQALLPWKRYYKPKLALSGVELRVQRGEVVGVIGPNGAGKTTLLKIIAGISYPTRGRVNVNGRVIAVLALGLGFHSRLTGLENLQLAGMMLGMSRDEVRRKRDWIVDFAELGDYISRPISTYSSGMRARLSFAVAACQEPEILIIDEALATGDVRFVQKCINRIHEVTRSGTTALFVSHNIWSIRKLTERSILLDGGRIVDDGGTGRVCDRYYEVMLRNEVFESARDSPADQFVGTGAVRVQRAHLEDASGSASSVLNAGDPAALVLELHADRDLRGVVLSAVFWRDDGIIVTAVGSMAGGALDEKLRFSQEKLEVRAGASTVRIEFSPLMLAPGDYSIEVHLFDAESHSGLTSNQQYYFKPRLLEFAVRRLTNLNRSIVYYQPARMILTRKDGDAPA